MFVEGNPEHTANFVTKNIVVEDEIPLQFSHLKKRTFSDWEIPPWELFIFEDHLLGVGSFAKVYLSKWRETLVVAKVIDKECNKQLILREIDIMSKLRHPNVVQFLGYIDEPFILVMEYIPNGNLLEKIKTLKYKQKLTIMKDVLRGLAYLHNRKPQSLIHRDIKPTNVLLTHSNSFSPK